MKWNIPSRNIINVSSYHSITGCILFLKRLLFQSIPILWVFVVFWSDNLYLRLVDWKRSPISATYKLNSCRTIFTTDCWLKQMYHFHILSILILTSICCLLHGNGSQWNSPKCSIGNACRQPIADLFWSIYRDYFLCFQWLTCLLWITIIFKTMFSCSMVEIDSCVLIWKEAFRWRNDLFRETPKHYQTDVSIALEKREVFCRTIKNRLHLSIVRTSWLFPEVESTCSNPSFELNHWLRLPAKGYRKYIRNYCDSQRNGMRHRAETALLPWPPTKSTTQPHWSSGQHESVQFCQLLN